MNFSLRVSNQNEMAHFGKESYALVPGLLTADPCLNFLFRYKAIFVFWLEISRRINIWESFVIIKLFPVEHTVWLEVLLFEFGLLNFLLFPLLGLYKFLLLFGSESSILKIFSITNPWVLLTGDSALVLSQFFVLFRDFFAFIFCL